jgi:predicted nucleic acid-binding protein
VVNLKTSVAAGLSYLDAGEVEAITLALEQPGTLLLMDDRHGIIEARKRGVEVVGTLAVLDRAAARGWIDLQEIVPVGVLSRQLAIASCRRNQG